MTLSGRKIIQKISERQHWNHHPPNDSVRSHSLQDSCEAFPSISHLVLGNLRRMCWKVGNDDSSLCLHLPLCLSIALFYTRETDRASERHIYREKQYREQKKLGRWRRLLMERELKGGAKSTTSYLIRAAGYNESCHFLC